MEIITTQITRPPRILVYGEQGIGKSTLGSKMPNPVFIATSDGLQGLGVKTLGGVAQTAAHVRAAIAQLVAEEHDFKTVVVDHIGALELLVHQEVMAELGLEFMTQSSVKSYPLAALRMRQIFQDLSALNAQKNMYVLFIGHSTIQKFEDPITASYDRYELDMNEKVGAFFKKEVDIVGFITQKVRVSEEKDGWDKSNKARGTNRVIYFSKQPSFYAKDHDYGLPSEIPFEKETCWQEIYRYIKGRIVEQRASAGSAGAGADKPPVPAAVGADKHQTLVAGPVTAGAGVSPTSTGADSGKDTRGDLSAVKSAQTERRRAKEEKAASEKAAAEKDDIPESFTIA